MEPQTIAVLDFGSQYAQLIARRVRENSVHSLLCPPDVSPDDLRRLNVAGLILSDGPSDECAAGAPACHPGVFELGVPVLGICHGMHVASRLLGGEIGTTRSREHGRVRLHVDDAGSLLANVPSTSTVWMSRGEVVDRLSDDFQAMAHTESCRFAVVRHRTRPFYGLQFHPEVTHTPSGSQILRNFVYDVCGCSATWMPTSVVERTIQDVRRRVGPGDRVICGLSGGVDSSVTAALLHRAIPDRLVCIFVDNGLMRKSEVGLVEATFREHFRMDLRVVDAADAFLRALAGVADPRQKRIIIGREFIEAFKSEARTIANARFLAQGTVYPDVIESGHSAAGTATGIKLHHNVGGLPAELGFELIEPLRDLFKDEVRRVGHLLGLPHDMVWRHPFPGPGLAVRVIGPVTRSALDLLREVDAILLEEIRAAGWYDKIAQAFAVLLPIRTTGAVGDDRSCADRHVVAIRAVESQDFMTADWVRMDADVLASVSTRILNEVRGVIRVVYDISSKPPASIEWE